MTLEEHKAKCFKDGFRGEKLEAMALYQYKSANCDNFEEVFAAATLALPGKTYDNVRKFAKRRWDDSQKLKADPNYVPPENVAVGLPVGKRSEYNPHFTEKEYDAQMIVFCGPEWNVEGTYDNGIHKKWLLKAKEPYEPSEAEKERARAFPEENKDGRVWTAIDFENKRIHEVKQRLWEEEPTSYVKPPDYIKNFSNEGTIYAQTPEEKEAELKEWISQGYDPSYVDNYNKKEREEKERKFKEHEEWHKQNAIEEAKVNELIANFDPNPLTPEEEAEITKGVLNAIEELGIGNTIVISQDSKDALTLDEHSYEYIVENDHYKKDTCPEDKPYQKKVKKEKTQKEKAKEQLEDEIFNQKHNIDPWNRNSQFRAFPHKFQEQYENPAYLYMKGHYAGVFDGIPKALDPKANFFNDHKLAHKSLDNLRENPLPPELPYTLTVTGHKMRKVVDESLVNYHNFNCAESSLKLKKYLDTGIVELLPEYQEAGQLIPNFHLSNKQYIEFYTKKGENNNPFNEVDEKGIPKSYIQFLQDKTEAKNKKIVDENKAKQEAREQEELVALLPDLENLVPEEMLSDKETDAKMEEMLKDVTLESIALANTNYVYNKPESVKPKITEQQVQKTEEEHLEETFTGLLQESLQSYLDPKSNRNLDYPVKPTIKYLDSQGSQLSRDLLARDERLKLRSVLSVLEASPVVPEVSLGNKDIQAKVIENKQMKKEKIMLNPIEKLNASLIKLNVSKEKVQLRLDKLEATTSKLEAKLNKLQILKHKKEALLAKNQITKDKILNQKRKSHLTDNKLKALALKDKILQNSIDISSETMFNSKIKIELHLNKVSTSELKLQSIESQEKVLQMKLDLHKIKAEVKATKEEAKTIKTEKKVVTQKVVKENKVTIAKAPTEKPTTKKPAPQKPVTKKTKVTREEGYTQDPDEEQEVQNFEADVSSKEFSDLVAENLQKRYVEKLNNKLVSS